MDESCLSIRAVTVAAPAPELLRPSVVSDPERAQGGLVFVHAMVIRYRPQTCARANILNF
jgi:hypothetical protein